MGHDQTEARVEKDMSDHLYPRRGGVSAVKAEFDRKQKRGHAVNVGECNHGPRAERSEKDQGVGSQRDGGIDSALGPYPCIGEAALGRPREIVLNLQACCLVECAALSVRETYPGRSCVF